MIVIEINKIENLPKDFPQLIVALDSLDDSSNYIHIADAKENTDYYCPCCKKLIKPRAYKNDREYDYQAHYYHERNAGCNDETFIHYICKTWLFEKGCKFKVEDILYEVKKVETEKTYHTEFGDYRPDITVTTTSGKVFFFEIKHSNRKTEHYIPKWDELGNDVVEVDTRYFINQKYINDIPEFKLIYSNGECFIKSYTNKDYDDIIAKIKLEWKRQDKLNYKIMWERLDWFWIKIQDFKSDKVKIVEVFNSFDSLDNQDKEICFEIIKKMSCVKQYNDRFRDILNNSLVKDFNKEYLQTLLVENLTANGISFKEKQGVYINCKYKSKVLSTDFNESYCSREWIFRYSEIVKLINKINTKANHYNFREERVIEFKKVFYEIRKDLNKLFKNTIWEIKEFEYLKLRECYDIKIGIKNSDSYFHNKSFNIYCEEFDDIDKTAIYNKLINTMELYMNIIHRYINMNDGICSEYRHVFTNERSI